MSDPDERLSSFDPGPSMNPLPPADVRRQGERLRRRNNALAGAGAALAVAVIVTPIAVLSTGGDGDAGPDPARPAGVDWVTTIPARFPVDDGMGGDSGIPTQVGTDVVSGEQVLPAINLCGTDVWSPTDAADTLGATWSDRVEGGEQRTLALYADDATAERSLSRVAAAVEGCTPSGSAAVPAPLDSDLAEQSTAWVLQYLDSGRPTGDTDVWQVARVGNALLLDKTYVPDADPEVSQQTVTLLAERAAGVVDAMCVFAAEGCATPSPSPAEPTTAPAASGGIPDDFPIDWDLVDMTGDGGEIDGPGPDARGAIEVSPCDRVVWPAAGVDRLALTTTGPEFEESRELVLFASADEAVAVMDGCQVGRRRMSERDQRAGSDRQPRAGLGPARHRNRLRLGGLLADLRRWHAWRHHPPAHAGRPRDRRRRHRR